MHTRPVAHVLGWLLPAMVACIGASGQNAPLPVPPPHKPARPGIPAAAARPVTPVAVITNAAAPRGATAYQPGKPGVLEFDAMSKHVVLDDEERKASFVFAVTNRSAEDVTISFINTSCGCTAGRLPSSPWVLKPDEGGHIDVTLDGTGKLGQVTKTATVVSSAGSYMLTVGVTIPVPAPNAMNRNRNLQVAAADRQAVFRGECAACHAQPVYGKMGHELYDAACGICHEAEHRASMVPDLRTRLRNTDRNYWAKWISDGRVGSLMPAFAARNGGVLTDQQIVSLVDYLEDEYKANPPPAKHAAGTPAGPSATASRP